MKKMDRKSRKLFKVILMSFLIPFMQFNFLIAEELFVPNGQKITTSNSWVVNLADFNGDGKLDAYFEGKIWLNKGKGNFAKTNRNFGTGLFVNFADLNGDGLIDGVSQDKLYLDDGNHHYSISGPLSSDIVMHSAVLVDLDNDTDIDIISLSTTQDRILLNNGKGHFTNTGKKLGGWAQAKYAFGDINGDGFTDIYVAIPHTPPPMVHSPNKIWLSDGKKGFIERDHDIPKAVSRSAILSDFDNDGDLDLFVASNGDTGNLIFFNDGKGNFTNSGQKLGNNSNSAKTADFDNDGDLDLFICHGQVPLGNGASNMIWLNDGKGHFTDSRLRLGNSNSAAVALGDINQDGKIDAVVVNTKLDKKNSYKAVPMPLEIWLNKSSDAADNKIEFTDLKGDYLGQKLPGDSAVIFAPGIVSVNGRYEYGVSFTPDLKEIYFTGKRKGERASVYFSKLIDKKWTNPKKANLTKGKKKSEFEAFVNLSGKKIYFTANDSRDIKIWCASRSGNWWSNAKVLDSPINDDIVFYPNEAKNGDLFYKNVSKRKMYYAPNKNGKFPEIFEVGIEYGSHGFIAPSQDFMLIDARKDNDKTKDKDIHVCFKKKDGAWTKPINLGSAVNSSFNETCPSITPDGKYLFFSRYDEEGGLPNIYWVSAKIIDELKKQSKANLK